MFIRRATETSRFSLPTQLRSISFVFVLAVLVVFCSSKAFANTTHYPTTVTCSAAPGGYDQGTGTSVFNPTPTNPAIVDATNPAWVENSVGEQCAWSGFGGSGTSVSGDTVSFDPQVVSTSPCSGDMQHKAVFTYTSFVSGGGIWSSKSYSGGTITEAIPSGTNLSDLTIYFTVFAGANDSCEVTLTLTSLSASF